MRTILGAAALVAGLLALHPARAAPAGGAPAAGVPAQASPETQKRVAAAVAMVSTMAGKAVAAGEVPGLAIAVVFDDRVVLARGFGVRDAAAAAPVDADTVFQLASVSKPIAATVVAALVGEGKLAWDSRISDLDPAFALADPWITRQVTVADLLSHRSGLPEHAGDLLEDLGASRAEVLHQLRFQTGGGPFRAAYAYTNFGFTEAAVAAAAAAGQSWEDVSRSRLYGPLGMTSTSSRFADFMARPDRAAGHVRVAGRWVARAQRDPDAQAPAGGVSSSASDLARWMRLELGEGRFEGRAIVAAEALAETRQPMMRTGVNHLTGAPTFYGLGWNVGWDPQGRLRLSHSGGFAMGAATAVYLVPSEHLGIVVLTNAAPVGVAEGLTYAFIDEALYGRQTYDWPALFRRLFADPATIGVETLADYARPPPAPAPAAAPAAYVGTYANAFYGDAVVGETGGALTLTLGPRRMTFPLAHYDRDIFTYQTVGENAAGRSGVTFTLGADGRAGQVLIENLNVRGEGQFVRRPAPAP